MSDMKPEEAAELMNKFMEEYTSMFVKAVQDKTPVLTGKLRDAWSGEVVGSSMLISNTMPYASFVEYGTYKMAPVGMLTATLNEAEQIAKRAAYRVGLNK